MKLKFIVLIAALLSFNHYLYSQQEDFISITGTVILENKQPVPFAHLVIKGKNMGGITNQDGFFNYRIPIEYEKDTLQISSLGLESIQVLVSDLIVAGDDTTLVMKEEAVELEGITIYAPSKLLQEAFTTLEGSIPEEKYFSCKGLYTLTSEENEKYTMFEQLAFESYYRGKIDDPGINILAHRRSFDFSQFPVLFSQTSQSHHYPVSREILGITALRKMTEKRNQLDELDLKITDVLELDGQKVYVVTEFDRTNEAYVNKYYNYYIREHDHQLVRLTEIFGNLAFRPKESMTNNGKYNSDLFEINQSYYFSIVNGHLRVDRAKRVFKWMNLDRLTGNLINVHKQIANVWLYEFKEIEQQPEKFPSNLKLPDKTPYDRIIWDQLATNTGYVIPAEIESDLNFNTGLQQQYEETNGLIILKNSIRKESFDRKDQRKQAEIQDVKRFIEELKNNNYVSDFAPKLSWEDIPALMELAGSTKMLTNFPRNILGRYYIEQCQLGIVAMWLIDSIRKNEGKKPRKAWYISPFPVLKSEGDEKKIEEYMSAGHNANILVRNTDEKLRRAHDSYLNWWMAAQHLKRRKAKRLNPLADTDIKWLGL